MKTLTAALALTTALVLPGMAMARQVTLTTSMKNYGGNGAYLAYYLTDKSGNYAQSLWMAGGGARYYEHLTAWTSAVNGDIAQIDGITGASVGGGQTLTLTLDLPDNFFDAGYSLHVDAGVENMRESPNEVVLPLTGAGNGKTVAGHRYISALTYAF